MRVLVNYETAGQTFVNKSYKTMAPFPIDTFGEVDAVKPYSLHH